MWYVFLYVVICFPRQMPTKNANQVIQQYLRECFRYDSIYQNAKYTVMEMLTKRRHPDHLKVIFFAFQFSWMLFFLPVVRLPRA